MPLDALPVGPVVGLGFVASHANLTLLELLTQLLVVPSPLAISAVDQPCVLETITSLTIASPFGESPLQSITRESKGTNCGLEILSLRPAELESGSVGDRRDECEAVRYVAQREALGRESPHEISSRHPRRHFAAEQLTV